MSVGKPNPDFKADTSGSKSRSGHHDDRFVDRQGRSIRLQRFDGHPAEVEKLVDMYTEFHAADRAQGLPPIGASAIRRWLCGLDGLHVVTSHRGIPVGHAVLAPDGEATAELAIFIRPSYQSAGIGTHTLDDLLDYGARMGVSEVWLHVERRNDAAVALYQKYEFAVTEANPVEFEMRRVLDDPAADDR